MKSFLIAPLLFIILCSCSYGSREQAEVACQEWSRAGKDIKVDITSLNEYFKSTGSEPLENPFPKSARECEEELITKQFIGKEKRLPSYETEPITDEAFDELGSHITKHFRY